MKVEEGVVPVIGTGITIEIETGSGTDTETAIELGNSLGSGMAEEAGKGEERWTGSTGIPGMDEMDAGTSTVIGAGPVPLFGMDIGGLLEVQFAHISGLCR